MSITYRNSEFTDTQKVRDVILGEFGAVESRECFKHLDDRYLLAFDNERLIGLVSYPCNGRYIYKSISLCIVDNDYQKEYIAIEMIRHVLTDINEPVVFEGWRINKNEYVNLHGAFAATGFKLWKRNTVTASGELVICADCPHHSSNCVCHKDLYIRY